MQLFAEKSLDFRDNTVQFTFIRRENEHVIHIPQIMVRPKRLCGVTVERREIPVTQPRACIKSKRQAGRSRINHAVEQREKSLVAYQPVHHAFKYARVHMVIKFLHVKLRDVKLSAAVSVPPALDSADGVQWAPARNTAARILVHSRLHDRPQLTNQHMVYDLLVVKYRLFDFAHLAVTAFLQL